MTVPAGAGIVLDGFQIRAIEHLDAGRSVLVSAPTGSGKTLVADHAVDSALAAGLRAFYTTPIKALSNQKYRDMCERLGSRRVGLLTGDNAIAAGADAVVMTTEVLRNMLYAGSVDDRLAVVVLDEVHYLEDAYRGAVWEEVILNLPERVRLVCLSATVSNHDELGGWLEREHGPTGVVVETRRPVPLRNLYAVGHRHSRVPSLFPILVDGRPNPRGRRFDAPAGGLGGGGPQGRDRGRGTVQAHGRGRGQDQGRGRGQDQGRGRGQGRERGWGQGRERGRGQGRDQGRGRGQGRERGWGQGQERGWGRGRGPSLPWRPPRRVDLLAALKARDLLPAIWFVFSRKGCDRAAARLARDGVRYTDDDMVARIDEVVSTRLAGLDPDDLDALGAHRWAAGLRLGVASHHAGMVPAFKEAVEQCFAEGLVQVVFATETLALGVNLPARSVVIDTLSKFDGQANVPLSPAQYAQFSGRAGRRGIDEVGCAVVAWSPGAGFSDAAALASSKSFRLRSAFRPTYNMVAAMLDRLPPDAARGLMRRSFAQYQADASSRRTVSAGRTVLEGRTVEDGRIVEGRIVDGGTVEEGRIVEDGRTVDAGRTVSEGRVDLVERFDAVCDVLRERGHLEGWSLTESGALVARIFHESDLAVAEALHAGELDGLSPAELASVLSCFTYEHRSAKPRPEVWIPSGTAYHRMQSIDSSLNALQRAERRRGLDTTRALDTGFAPVAHRWASGEPFEAALLDGFSAGDFVRNVKQVADLARRIAAVAPDARTAATAGRTLQALNRGVVAMSGTVHGTEADPEAP